METLASGVPLEHTIPNSAKNSPREIYVCVPIVYNKNMNESKKIQFDEPVYKRPLSRTKPQNKFASFLIEKKIAKDEDQATYILLGIVGACILVVIFYMFSGGSPEIFTEEEVRILDIGRPIK
jgi:hypothetical protein